MVEIYIDGSALNNGKKNSSGGYGAIVFEDGKIIHAHNEKFNNTTNNQMELKALIYALELTQTKYKNKKCVIYSDSLYCVRIWNEWLSIWSRNDWKRTDNKEIINLDLIQSIYKYYRINFIGCQVKIKHCDGHKGILGNELADALATEDYKKFNKLLDDNYKI